MSGSMDELDKHRVKYVFPSGSATQRDKLEEFLTHIQVNGDPRMKTASWAVSFVSVLSSRAREKATRVEMRVFSVRCSTSPRYDDERCGTKGSRSRRQNAAQDRRSPPQRRGTP